MESYSLGIPVRNEANTIEPLIYEALRQIYPPKNIYVCVNGSSDGTQGIVTKLAGHFSQVIPLKSSPGKANAWNAIIQKMRNGMSGDEVLLFCDGDISLPSDQTLSRLVQLTRASSSLLLGTSTIQIPSRRKGPYKNRFPSGQLYAIKSELLEVLDREYDGYMPEDTINDDLFLTLLAFPYFDVTEEVFSTSQKPSLKDLIHSQLRILKGIKQMMDRGMAPRIEQMIRDTCEKRKDSILTNLKYRLVPLFAYFIKNYHHDNVWKEARSTKKHRENIV